MSIEQGSWREARRGRSTRGSTGQGCGCQAPDRDLEELDAAGEAHQETYWDLEGVKTAGEARQTVDLDLVGVQAAGEDREEVDWDLEGV